METATASRKREEAPSICTPGGPVQGPGWRRVARAAPHSAPARGLRLWLSIAVFLVAVSWGSCRSEPERPTVPAARAQPNIVLITLCSIRADRLGAYGYSDASTPNIDALARLGTTFEYAWSNATFTLASHAAMITGLWPGHTGVLDVHDELGPAFTTLAEVLKAHGYRTMAAAQVASGASFRAEGGMERGFDVFLTGQVPDLAEVTEDDGRRTPFFALLHDKSAHLPYQIENHGPDPRLIRWAHGRLGAADADQVLAAEIARDPPLLDALRGYYDRAVTSSDDYVGRVLHQLAAEGALDDTVVVVVGDHGEILGEGDIFGHQGLLLEHVMRVPLIVSGPGVGQGQRIETDASLVDLMPTIIELAGISPPAQHDGRSLVPALQNGTLAPRPALSQAVEQQPDGSLVTADAVTYGPYRLHYSNRSSQYVFFRRDSGGQWTEAQLGDDPMFADLQKWHRAKVDDMATSHSRKELTEEQVKALQREGYW